MVGPGEIFRPKVKLPVQVGPLLITMVITRTDSMVIKGGDRCATKWRHRSHLRDTVLESSSPNGEAQRGGKFLFGDTN